MATDTLQLALEALEAGLDHVRGSPRLEGTLDLIVRRPGVGRREALEHGELTIAEGLVGDSWATRGRTPDPNSQLNLMNSRVIALLSPDRSRWPLAGDQLFVDLDLSSANVPAGTRLAVGEALVEVTAKPHTGCGKFARSFGVDAVKFVNTAEGRRFNLRGVNARVVKNGTIRVGDRVRRLARE